MGIRPARILLNLRVVLIGATWALLGLDSFILWVLIADYTAWLMKYPPRRCDPNTFRANHFPDRLYELVPSNKFNFYFGSRLIWKKFRKVPTTINSLGFRGPEIKPKDKKKFRVMILGDSQTFGAGVEDGKEFVRILEDLLNKDEKLPCRIELLNMAVDGYNTRQEVAVLRQYINQIEPDMVWMFISLNDAFVWGSIQVQKNGTLFRPGSPLRIRLRNFITEFSGLGWWVHDAYRYIRIISHLNDLWDTNHAGYQDWKKVMRQYAELVESPEKSITFILPVLYKLYNYPWTPIHQQIKKDVETCGLAGIDVLPALQGKEASQLWCHYLDQHPNSEGHKILAEYMAQEPEMWKMINARMKS